MPAIIIKSEKIDGKLEEYLMIELQGDLECRLSEETQDSNGKFIGDLFYTKYSAPV